VFIPAVPSISRQCSVVYDNTHRFYGVSLKFDRNTSAGLRGRPAQIDPQAQIAALDILSRLIAQMLAASSALETSDE